MAAKKSPKKGVYPTFCTSTKQKAIWDQVLTDYNSYIKEQNTIKRQWGLTFLLYEKLCKANRVLPINIKSLHEVKDAGRITAVKDLRNSLIEARNQANAFIEQTSKGLIADKKATKLMDEKWYNSGKKNHNYYIAFGRKITIRKNYEPASIIRMLIQYYRCQPVNVMNEQAAVYRTKWFTVKFKFITPTTLQAITYLWLNKEQALLLLGPTAYKNIKDEINSETVAPLLKKVATNWLRSGKIIYAGVMGDSDAQL